MAKEKISDEEFERLEGDRRHEELLSVLREVSKRSDTSVLENALAKQSQQITALLQKDISSSLVAELKPLIKELTTSVKDLKGVLNQKSSASFRIQRTQTGLIERVVVEKSYGN